MLAALDLDKKIRMEVDMSDYVIGGFDLQIMRIDDRDLQCISQNLSMRQKGTTRFITRKYWQ